MATLADNKRPAPCFAMRSYEFAQDDPTLGVARFTGSTTCQAAKDVRLKSADATAK